MDEKKGTEVFFPNGIWVYLIACAISVGCKEFFQNAFLNYGPIFVSILYIIWALNTIFNSKVKKMFELEKVELVCYQIVIPITVSVLIGLGCFGIKRDGADSLGKELASYFLNSDNQVILVMTFSFLLVICYFIAYERAKLKVGTKEGCQFSNEYRENLESLSSQNTEVINGVSKGVDKLSTNIDVMLQDINDIKNKVDKKKLGYTVTCIPMRYIEEHNSFGFILVQNESHSQSQWMFPGSHVEVSDNLLGSTFDLEDVKIVPENVILDKTKSEAGLVDLKFMDPYYDKVSFANTQLGKDYCYPNTCYPMKAPVFNYLFRVNESARCYQKDGHRCHYDFTYIAEYESYDVTEAKYKVAEIEISKDKIATMKRGEAIAQINSSLVDQINKIIKSSKKKNSYYVNIPLDKLCLDSIPEMMYNAILFYTDYKKL